MGPLQPIDVARLEDRRCAQAISEIAPQSAPWCGGCMNYERPGSWANFALGVPFEYEFTTEDFERLVAFYAERGAPARVGITPFHHESVIARLREHGFVLHEFESVFAADLSSHTLAEPFEPPAGLDIGVVDVADDDAVRAFAEISTSGFVDPGEDIEPHLPIMIEAAKHPRAVNLVATIDGEPAGAGSVEVAGEVAALYAVSTLEPFRRRGVQRALMFRRLEIAGERGCRVAVIASKPGIATERNALRAGFTPSYTHVQMEKPIDG